MAEKKIKSVKFLGVRTAQESTVFSVVNFAVYSFYVEYVDGSSKTVEMAPDRPHAPLSEKKNYTHLMAIANSPAESEPQGKEASTDVISELKSLKELYDAGVVPQELFDKKRDTLLEELQKDVNSQQTGKAMKTSQELIIRREKPRSVLSGKSSLIVDGINQQVDLDKEVSIQVPLGQHTIMIQRAAITKRIVLMFTEQKTYVITFDDKTFHMKTKVEERITE